MRARPVTSFLAVTVAPGTTPPVESVTVPRIVAVDRWARAGAAAATSAATTNNRIQRIDSLPAALAEMPRLMLMFIYLVLTQ